jgi:hypothetical protein
MLSKNSTRCFGKISMYSNVRPRAWLKEEISTTTFMGRLGHHCTSIYSLLAQTIGLPTTSILRVKYSPGQLKTIKIHALKGLDAIFGEKTTLFCRIIKQ